MHGMQLSGFLHQIAFRDFLAVTRTPLLDANRACVIRSGFRDSLGVQGRYQTAFLRRVQKDKKAARSGGTHARDDHPGPSPRRIIHLWHGRTQALQDRGRLRPFNADGCHFSSRVFERDIVGNNIAVNVIEQLLPGFRFGIEEETILAERYVVVREIGRGGCARVYEAFDRAERRLVAIKLSRANDADERRSERLQREAEVGLRVRHPNICAVLDRGTLPSGKSFLVMERLFGETLRVSFARRQRFDASSAIAVCAEVLAALDALHAVGYVHRDVKPENIFIVGRCLRAKLIDLGMCCSISSLGTDDITLTTAGMAVGTLGYMSPEQLLGIRTFDARMDVFGVGAVLYEMLTGRRAFAACEDHTTVQAVFRSPPWPHYLYPDIPRSVEAVVLRAIEHDPDGRYQSTRSFRDALLEASDDPCVRMHTVGDLSGLPACELPTRRFARVA